MLIIRSSIDSIESINKPVKLLITSKQSYFFFINETNALYHKVTTIPRFRTGINHITIITHYCIFVSQVF